MLVTFVTSWYVLNSKFPPDTYLRWMRHMLLEINNYYLVLFTDEAGEQLLKDHFAPYYFNNPKLKIIQKPVEQWYNYNFKKINNNYFNKKKYNFCHYKGGSTDSYFLTKLQIYG